MKLPLLISVPHAGLEVHEELIPYCRLDPFMVGRESDQGAAEIYAPFERHVEGFVTTEFARALIDCNRAREDRSPSGVVKTESSWGDKVFEPFPPEALIQSVLDRYYAPYHAQLTRLAKGGVRLGVDCHTMREKAPPGAPDPEGRVRPMVCLSDRHGQSLPAGWMTVLAGCFREQFDGWEVSINKPFGGGYITRAHMTEIPWVQIELSRTNSLTDSDKSERCLRALTRFCQIQFGSEYNPFEGESDSKKQCWLIRWLMILLGRRQRG